MNRRNVQWEITNAASLIGATIGDVIKTSDFSSYGFRVQLSNGEIRNVWIDGDPEGNGPGHLAIESVNALTHDQFPAR